VGSHWENQGCRFRIKDGLKILQPMSNPRSHLGNKERFWIMMHMLWSRLNSRWRSLLAGGYPKEVFLVKFHIAISISTSLYICGKHKIRTEPVRLTGEATLERHTRHVLFNLSRWSDLESGSLRRSVYVLAPVHDTPTHGPSVSLHWIGGNTSQAVTHLSVDFCTPLEE